MTDRMKSALESFVRRITRRYDYAGAYAYTVVSQNTDGTLELQPDAAGKMPGLSHVPCAWGDPGTTATVSKGARCRVMFADQSPEKPFVLGWENGASIVVTHGGGTQPLARQGDLIQAGGPGLVVTLMPLYPIPAPPGTIAPGTPITALISFSATPPTPASATPLYGVVGSGSDTDVG